MVECADISRRHWVIGSLCTALFVDYRLIINGLINNGLIDNIGDYSELNAQAFSDIEDNRRIIVAFGEDDDIAVEQFLELVRKYRCELDERDVDIFLVTSHQVSPLSKVSSSLDQEATNYIRSLHQPTDTAFELILIDKDGEIKARADLPGRLPQLISTIDGSAWRQREIEERGSRC